MGKKNKSKSKAKKAARNAEKLAENARRDTVRRAMWCADARECAKDALVAAGFEPSSPFRNYSRGDLAVHVSFACPADLSDAEKDRIFTLLKSNMYDHYMRAAEVEPAEWTWNDRKKAEELWHPDARYLVARAPAEGAGASASAGAGSGAGEIVAFTHFRFELEGIYTVLYVYELQIAPAAQKHGLGKRMMQLLEMVGMRLGMQWVMLTVFKGNDGAGAFYKALKYSLDEIDPSLSEETATDTPKPYEILSKVICKKLKTELKAMDMLNAAVAKDVAAESAGASGGFLGAAAAAAAPATPG